MFAQLGIPTYGIRVCAQVRDDREQLTRTVHELLFVNFATNAIAYAVLVAALFSVPRLYEDRVLFAILSVSIFLNSVHKQSDYVIYGAITIFASSASNILNLLNAHKYIGFKPVGSYNWKRHMKSVAVFFAMACATTVYTNLDNVMLGFMATDVDVGYYGAAVKIKTILVSIVTSLGAVILPRASYYVEQGMIAEFKEICKKALNFVFLVAAPFSIYFILFAKYGVFFLSGNEYAGSIQPMQVIMPTLLLIGITNILGIQILVPTGREKIVLYSEIAGAVVDVIINALLIPRMKSTGAAIGTLVAEAVVLLVQYYALRAEMKDAFRSIHHYRIIEAIALASIASLWVLRVHAGNFLTLVLSAITFFGVYGGFMIWRKEELVVDVIRQLTAKKKI